MEQTSTRHIYQIHVKKCAEVYIQKLELLEIEAQVKNRLITEVNVAVDAYYENIHDVNLALGIKEKDINIISTRHIAFNFWFALFLITRKKYEISFILDAYYNSDFGKIDNLNGQLKIFVLKIIENQVHFQTNDIINSIKSWMSESVDTIKIENNSDEYIMSTIDLIKTDLKYEEVYDYFKALHFNLKEDVRLTLVQVENLIYSNFYFKNSKTQLPPKIHLKINLEKQLVTNFIYYFYLHVDQNPYNKKLEDYVHFAIKNFELYKNDNFSSLKSNFNKSPKRANPLIPKDY